MDGVRALEVAVGAYESAERAASEAQMKGAAMLGEKTSDIQREKGLTLQEVAAADCPFPI